MISTSFNHLRVRNPLISTMANSEDPDEMPHDAAFHQGLFSLLRQYRFSEKEIQYFFEIITYDHVLNTMNLLDFSVCSFMETPVVWKYTGVQFRLPCTHTVCKIDHWDPLNAKQSCPQKYFSIGYVKMHGFYGNPLYDSRERGVAHTFNPI